jgi:hypothetical protein
MELLWSTRYASGLSLEKLRVLYDQCFTLLWVLWALPLHKFPKLSISTQNSSDFYSPNITYASNISIIRLRTNFMRFKFFRSIIKFVFQLIRSAAESETKVFINRLRADDFYSWIKSILYGKYCFASNEWLMFSDFFAYNRFEWCLALFDGKFVISEAVLYPMVTQRS